MGSLLQSVTEADLARARALVQGTTGKDALELRAALERAQAALAQGADGTQRRTVNTGWSEEWPGRSGIVLESTFQPAVFDPYCTPAALGPGGKPLHDTLEDTVERDLQRCRQAALSRADGSSDTHAYGAGQRHGSERVTRGPADALADTLGPLCEHTRSSLPVSALIDDVLERDLDGPDCVGAVGHRLERRPAVVPRLRGELVVLLLPEGDQSRRSRPFSTRCDPGDSRRRPGLHASLP